MLGGRTPRTATTAGVSFAPGAHYPALDGLRGLAILLVIVRHTSRYMRPDTAVGSAVQATLGTGWVGVDLFFVLSGFLITGILVDAKGSEHYFRNFYARRSLRIFPLYYGFLAVVFLVLPRLYAYDGGRFGALRENQTWYWTYLVNVLASLEGTAATPLNTTHLWSLAVEEQFYLVWPAVVLWCSRRRLFQLCVWMVVGALATRIAIAAMAGGEGHTAGYMLTPARMDTLALGALLALCVRAPGGPAWLARRAWPAAALSGAAVLVLFVVEGGLSWLDLTTQTIGFTAIALLAASLLAMVLLSEPGSRLNRTFDRGWLKALGAYSYAIYLFHYPLLNVFRYTLPMREVPSVWGTKIPAQIAFTAGVTLASFALAWVSWHTYEKHFLKLKRFFPSGAGPRAPTGGAWVGPDHGASGEEERAQRRVS